MAVSPPGGDPSQLPAPPAGTPALPPRRPGWRRALVLGAVILLIAGCAVYVLFVLGEDLGVQALLVGLVAAILPVPVLVACFLWLDRYEPEPVGYLLLCFAWGAFVATAISLNVNRLAAHGFKSAGLPDALTAVLVAPFIEELTKAGFPILLLAFRRRELSGITDGIVYCGLSATGFAMVENILYLGGYGFAAGAERYGPATGATYVFAFFIVRILLFGFAHPLFTSMTGVGLGIAARMAERRVRVLAPLAGLLVAMMLHGTWNLIPSLTAATGQGLIALYGYIGVMVPIFLGMVGFAVWLRSWEGRLTERRLPDYVRSGWLSPPEVAALGSLGRRHAARRW
ncbi:MAG TPA: PrsW family intramembrane metalloprotease, partial [Micromonosporaceae bacterium]